jgi:hypothetical protein
VRTSRVRSASSTAVLEGKRHDRRIAPRKLRPPGLLWGLVLACNNTRLSWKAETHVATCQSIDGRRD